MRLPFDFQPVNAVSEIYRELGVVTPAGLDDDIDEGSSDDSGDSSDDD